MISLNLRKHSFIHLVVCLTTGPKPLPKRALHIVRSRASSFKWEYPLLSLRSSSSLLRILPRLPVTFIPPCIFSSITHCRRQFLRKIWPIQFAFRLRISCRIFLYSLTLSNTSSFLTWSVQLIFSILLQHHVNMQICNNYRCFTMFSSVPAGKCWINKAIRPVTLQVPSNSTYRNHPITLIPKQWKVNHRWITNSLANQKQKVGAS